MTYVPAMARVLTICVLFGLVPTFAHAQYPCGANPYDTASDSANIQACLDSGSLTVALIPGASPGYLIDSTLTISRNGTVLTSNASGRVRLKAMTSFSGRILEADNKTSFELSHLNLVGRGDPNGDNKTAADLPGGASDCASAGQNARIAGSDFVIDDVESQYAVCGSGMVVDGSRFEVRNSYFHNNGRAEDEWSSPYSFADGMTVGNCDQCWIHDNIFEENTDIDLVIGGGSYGTVEDNVMTNNYHHGFAGLHVGWFPSGGGDHTGMTYQNNTISAAQNKLAFGIIVGFEPWWDPFANVQGFVVQAGSVVNNSISGAVVNLAIDGIGDGYIQSNSMSGAQGSYGLGGCGYSDDYTAHYFGAASIQSGWTPYWFFHGGCGSWNTSLPQPDNPGAMVHEQKLDPGQWKSSSNGSYHLKYQTDGNLVLYDSTWSDLWNIALFPTPGQALMQADGNFVCYNSGDTPYFDTGSWGNDGAYVVVQDDGNVVVYSLTGTVLWSIW